MGWNVSRIVRSTKILSENFCALFGINSPPLIRLRESKRWGSLRNRFPVNAVEALFSNLQVVYFHYLRLVDEDYPKRQNSAIRHDLWRSGSAKHFGGRGNAVTQSYGSKGK